MKVGPKCSRNCRRAEIRFTMEGVVGFLKSVSPGSMESDGLSKSTSTPSKPYSVTIRVIDETKFGTRFGSASVKCCPPPPSEIMTFLPWLFRYAMSLLNCAVSSPAGVGNCMVPSGAFRSGVEKAIRMMSHCGDSSRRGIVEPGPP